MKTTFNKAKEIVLELPPLDRCRLLDQLGLEGALSDSEVDFAWDKEIATRLLGIDSGEVEGIPLEAVVAGVREDFGL